MKVALVYDRINKWGGAERVLLTLHEIFPDAPLFTSVYHPEKAKWASVFNVKTSFLQNFPMAQLNHELYASLMPLVFESFSFDKYDLVISVTSEAAKGILTKSHTKHICYCLTPTRYLWSGYDDYFNNPFIRLASFPAVSYLRHWDKIASSRPDYFIAISEEVKKRIKRYYKIDSEVIYPPLTNFEFKEISLKEKNYYLLVSRMVKYKKIDVAVKAFNKLGLPLKIIGTGIDEKYLKNLAKSNIQFLGNLTDQELVGYYMNCKALVFPSLEDFGLTVLEVQGLGKPAICFKGGGALETIIEGKTGEYFYPQCADALIEAIEKFKKKKYLSKDCQKQAEKFSKTRFKDDLNNFIKRIF